MDDRVLSIFVDESGRFQYPDADSRFYIVSMVFHDQLADVSGPIREFERGIEAVKIYYDCGQSPVTNLLHATFEDIGCPVEFAQGVAPARYRLFQLADLICTLRLIALKISVGDKMSPSEFAFFGSPRTFRLNVLKYIRRKHLA